MYFLLNLMENNRKTISSYLQANYHNFRKMLMCSEIGFDNIALLLFGKFKMAEANISPLWKG